jgi:non-ribosomal peptide synthetase component F
MIGTIDESISVKIEDLAQLEKKLEITRAVLIQCIWSLTLYKYTRNEHVLFGMLTSGREQDIPNVER